MRRGSILVVDDEIEIREGASPAATLRREEIRRACTMQGSGPWRAALALLREIATELTSKGTYESLARHRIPAKEVNGMFSARKKSANQET